MLWVSSLQVVLVNSGGSPVTIDRLAPNGAAAREYEMTIKIPSGKAGSPAELLEVIHDMSGRRG